MRVPTEGGKERGREGGRTERGKERGKERGREDREREGERERGREGEKEEEERENSLGSVSSCSLCQRQFSPLRGQIYHWRRVLVQQLKERTGGRGVREREEWWEAGKRSEQEREEVSSCV